MEQEIKSHFRARWKRLPAVLGRTWIRRRRRWVEWRVLAISIITVRFSCDSDITQCLSQRWRPFNAATERNEKEKTVFSVQCVILFEPFPFCINSKWFRATSRKSCRRMFTIERSFSRRMCVVCVWFASMVAMTTDDNSRPDAHGMYAVAPHHRRNAMQRDRTGMENERFAFEALIRRCRWRRVCV